MRSKICDIELLLESRNIDVLCLTETFLRDDNAETLQLPNYKIATYFSRQKKSRGGVCIYVKKSINFKKIDWISEISIETHFECCGLEIPETNWYIICLYRTPNSNLCLFIEKLELLLYKLTIRSRALNKKIFITGDFNIDTLICNTKSQLFKNTLKKFNLLLTLNNATRITSHSATCIDNIITNHRNYKAEIWDLGMSDHTCQVIKIPCSISFKEKYWFKNAS